MSTVDDLVGTRWPQAMNAALDLPSGARFFKCALQVNPYAYLERHGKQTAFKDEETYNRALIEAFQQHDIEVLGVADHYKIGTSISLIRAAREAGLTVFPGFEATTKDGVHFLCLFDPNRSVKEIERIIGDCGVHDDTAESPTGKYDVTELLEEAERWSCLCIAVHVAGAKGLLTTLKGQRRINAWKHVNLLATSLPGTVQEAPEGLRHILENADAQHSRQRPIAIINSSDIQSPEDVASSSSYCWIKMSSVSIDGLRLAFLDPSSRIRLFTDPEPEPHTEFLAIGWQGGFLDGCAIHFNENLNVLIGGRGTGKSSVIESLRFVLGLDTLGDEARKAYDGIVRSVLRSGTKVSLLVRSHKPSPKEYLVERTIPNPPVIRDETGAVLDLSPTDVIAGVEIYGQHEIAELAKSPGKLIRLLNRFVEADPALPRKKRTTKQRLERSRTRIIQGQREQEEIVDRLSAFPALEETLKRFQNAGLEERLKEQSLLVREERIVNTMFERIAAARESTGEFQRLMPIDRAFLSERALSDLPGGEILARADDVLQRLEQKLTSSLSDMNAAIESAESELSGLRATWEERKAQVQDAYEAILRELQRSRVDGEEFIRLRRQIEELRPLKGRLTQVDREIKELQDERRNLLAEWEDITRNEFLQLDRAAKKVTKQLANRVRVRVSYGGNREPLLRLLREEIGGRLNEALSAIGQAEDISLRELAEACRSGSETLAKKFNMPPSQAERLAQAPPEVCLAIEELELPSTASIELNVAAAELDSSIWRELEDLSTGQKATAVLLLLLLESDSPLIVDQPEDDLDNRFISDSVVPKMRQEKRRRQFVFATHNANIPVLGDADLIVGLEAAGEAGEGRAEITADHMGSIDLRPIRDLVEELLEGGREAFEMRRLKYGF